jgi:FHA domain
VEKYTDEVPLLLAQAGPLNGQRWALRKTFILGREPGCDIVIADRLVSRHHARITLSARGILLEDLGSKNGTHHNGRIIQDPALLADGDVIQIALAQQFIFLSSDSTIPLENQPTDLLELQATGPQTKSASASSGKLRLENRSRRVWIRVSATDEPLKAQEILPPLSVSQFRLLEILYENQDRVVTRPELITTVWGESQAFDISEQALDALVRRLRDRIANADPTYEYIVTVRGHGLRLENPI